MDFTEQRKRLVENFKNSGILRSSAVERAMLKVRREDFVLPHYKKDAYLDVPLPIPGGATISAPSMHAICLEKLQLKPGEKFLEVGAGSGIVEAYARELVGRGGKVIGVEFIEETYKFGLKNLHNAGYSDVKFILGDGSKGLPKEAPFDKILISAACPDIPKPLVDQLRVRGIIVAVVGPPYGDQELVYFKKLSNKKFIRRNLLPVIYLPLVGEYGWKE